MEEYPVILKQRINQKITGRLPFGNVGIKVAMELVEKRQSREGNGKRAPLASATCSGNVTAVGPSDSQCQAQAQTDTGL
jgi:hypothetical protein